MKPTTTPVSASPVHPAPRPEHRWLRLTMACFWVSIPASPEHAGKGASNRTARMTSAGRVLAAGVFFCLQLLFLNPLMAQSSAADKARAGELRLSCTAQVGAGPEMVLIAVGDFQMGSPKDEIGRYDDETPRHPVAISKPFAIGRCEVTVGEFRRFVEASGYLTSAERGLGCRRLDKASGQWKENPTLSWRLPGFIPYDDQHPVVCVSWEDAQAYIAWLNHELGLPTNSYRLPSEAEWEYAARAGTDTAYFWGDSNAEQCAFANGRDQAAKASSSEFFDKNSTFADCSDGFDFTAPVASFKPNGFGLFDTTGNVLEWVQDCYHDSYKGAPGDGRAWQEDGCENRVLRGGSWINKPSILRSAYRGWFRPVETDSISGFRLARTL